MSDFFSQISTIKKLSNQMLELATSGNWDRFPALQKEREALITQAAHQAYTAQQTGAARSLLEEIKTIDQQIMALADSGRSEARSLASAQSNRNKAINAYKGL